MSATMQLPIHTPKFPCEHCNRIFVSKKSLSHHLRIAHEFIIACPIYYCHKKFNTIRRMQIHFQHLHHVSDATEGTHKCSHCPQRFDDVKYLRRHEKKVHYGLLQTFTTSTSCTFCGTFTNPNDFKKHQSHKLALTTTYLCAMSPSCGIQTHKLGAMKKHVATHDLLSMAPVRQVRASQKCPRCVYTTEHIAHLRRHISKNSCLDRKFVCVACGKNFKSQKVVRKHSKGPCPRKQLTGTVTWVRSLIAGEETQVVSKQVDVVEETQVEETQVLVKQVDEDVEEETDVLDTQAEEEVDNPEMVLNNDDEEEEVDESDMVVDKDEEEEEVEEVEEGFEEVNDPTLVRSLQERGGIDRLYMKGAAVELIRKRFEVTLKEPAEDVAADGECNTTSIAQSIGVKDYVKAGTHMRSTTVSFWRDLLTRNLVADDALFLKGISSLTSLMNELALPKNWDFDGADLASHLHSAATGRSLLVVDLDISDIIPIFPDDLVKSHSIGISYDPLKTGVVVKYRNHFEALYTHPFVTPILQFLRGDF